MAWQNQYIQPGILMGLRTHNDPIPAGERTFIMASNLKAMEDGYVPVKVNSLEMQGEDEVNG